MNGTQSCINITIHDDNIFEKEENFSLHIYSVEKGVEVHGHTYVTIQIHDNEGIIMMKIHGIWVQL